MSDAANRNRHEAAPGLSGSGELLGESEVRYRALFDANPHPMWVYDLETLAFLEVNDAAVAHYGYSRDELRAMTIADIRPPEDLPRLLANISHVGEPPLDAAGIWRHIKKDGTVIEVEITSHVLDYRGRRAELVLANDVTERRRMEGLLRRREQRLRLLTDNMVDAISQIDAERAVVYCSPSVARVFGITPEELIGRNAYERVHPEDVEIVRQHALQAIASRAASIRAQYRYRHGSGEYLWVESSIRLLYGENGEYAGAVLCSRDITERKLIEEALRQANLVVENSPAVLFRWRAAEGWPVALVSQNVSQFGYTPEELISGAVSFAAMVHPEDLDRVGREVQDYSAGGAVRFQQEYRIVTKDGRVRWVDDRTVVERNAEGQIVFYQGIVIDITERKRAEEALRESENMLSSIFRAAPTGIGVVSNRILLVVNDRVCEMIGCGCEELIGRSARVLYPSDADFEFVGAEKYRQIRERGTGTVETRWQCRDGRIIDVLMSSTPINPEDLAAGVTFTALDITERKRAEAALRSSLAEKESLLQEVHHRVKNTLQVISSLLNLQVRQTRNAKVQSFLRDTQNRISSMAMLHEILYRSGNLAMISFPQYLESVCAHLARSFGSEDGKVRLRQEIADVSLSLDQAVPAGLIINELVSNAFKHAFPDRTDGEIVVHVEPAGDQRLLLRVADDGVGMPAGLDARGAGTLGLRLVDTLVGQLDGQLTIGGAPGAVFEIVFPVRPVERSSA